MGPNQPQDRSVAPAAPAIRRPGRVVVVGSINVDLAVVTPRLPGPGETVTGGDIARHHGGKGGNQAVAAARLAAATVIVGAVGGDEFGSSARSALASEGVDVAGVATVARPTGVALIMVDGAAENLIAVAPGANAAVTPETVATTLRALDLGPGDVVLVSSEIPAASVRAALASARASAATTILNPAPADEMDAATLRLADVIVPNAAELAVLAGPGHPEAAARRLLAGGPSGRAVIVTLGQAGAVLVPTSGPAVALAAAAVVAVDTTGAGDAFSGALAAALAAGHGLVEASRRAVAAAGLSTTRSGAREGMPTTAELDAFLRAR